MYVEVLAIPTRRVVDASAIFGRGSSSLSWKDARFGSQLDESGISNLDSNCIVAGFCGLRGGSQPSVVYSHD